MSPTRIILLTALLIAGWAHRAHAQSGGSFEIVSYTIDGGGVVDATGGVFTLSGTVGQADAGPIQSGGIFEVAGGFWPTTVLAIDCPADFAEPFGVLNFFDVAAYIGLYNAGDPAADVAAPFGSLNFFDISTFIGLFNAGCP
ncbi:MAG: GC-type dockerin domain-anchored protein [Planctomycetota bacterium]